MASIAVATIKDIVYEIYSHEPGYEDKKAIFSDKYPDFVAAYPTLFEMVCLPRFNIDMFDEIISSCGKISGNKRVRGCGEEYSVATLERRLYTMYNTQKSLKEYLV